LDRISTFYLCRLHLCLEEHNMSKVRALFKPTWVAALLVATLLLPLSAAAAPPFPETIDLPNGFGPEGVVMGRGQTIYTGSIATGAIYQANVRTGAGSILVPAQTGRAAIGLDFDQRTGYLFVAGGPTGNAYVYDTATGATVAIFDLAPTAATFVNDVIVTQSGAYFTDSARPVLYRLPLGPGGRLPDPGVVEEIELGGDFEFVPGAFNTNGIVATPGGKALIIVNSALGTLYRVDPATGEATLIDTGGATFPAGDGLLLVGHRLFVVQNRLNQVSVVRLDASFTSGELVAVLTDPDFAVPTTITRFGGSLYAVNARFGTPVTPDTEYWITRLPMPGG
jgi:sugar lactone lactonase YvrE